jgi:hypothetical protein
MQLSRWDTRNIWKHQPQLHAKGVGNLQSCQQQIGAIGQTAQTVQAMGIHAAQATPKAVSHAGGSGISLPKLSGQAKRHAKLRHPKAALVIQARHTENLF